MPAETSTQAVDVRSSSAVSASHSEMLLAAYEGYWDLIEAGEAVSPEEYCGRFPELRSSLPELMRAHALFEDHEEKIGPARGSEADNLWPEAGDAFLDCQLRRELGRGAFSRVYLATQAALGNRPVAVKLYKKPMGEARILGPLNHPNIVPILSLQFDPSRNIASICMPYVGSSTLQRLLDLIGKDGRPARATALLHAAEDTAAPESIKEQASRSAPAAVLRYGAYTQGVCYLGVHIAEALAFLHRRGICHRDLKPSNVLLRPDGQPMLLDFNLSGETDKPMARMGGTLPYMSPEQLRAWWSCHQAAQAENQPLDGSHSSATLVLNDEVRAQLESVAAPADVFSLGVILYELFTGRHPFGPIPVKMSVEALHQFVLEQHKRGYQPVRKVCPDIDPQVAALVEQCLEQAPEKRPSAEAAAKRLRPHLAIGWRKWLRRNKWLVAVACAFFLTIGPAGAYVAYILRPDPMQEAVRLSKQGDTDRAISTLTELLRRDQSNFEARFMRGRLYQSMSEWLYAADDYRELDKKKPSDGRVKACLGYYWQYKGALTNLRGAIECYKEAIELRFDNAAVQNNLAFAYDRAGVPAAQPKEMPQAHQQHLALIKGHLDRALQHDPNFSVAWYNRAYLATNLYINSKDVMCLHDGLSDVENGLGIEKNADFYFLGARLAALAGKQSLASAYLRNAIDHGKKIAIADSALQALPDYHELLKRKPVSAYRRMPRTVDPLNNGPI